MSAAFESKFAPDNTTSLQECAQLVQQIKAEPNNPSNYYKLLSKLCSIKDTPTDQFLYIIIENNLFIETFFSYYEDLYIENESELLSHLLQTSSGRLAVARNVDKLSTLTVQEVVDRLYEFSDYQALSMMCSHRVDINQQAVVSSLLKQGDFSTIARDIDKYVQVDFSQIYTAFFRGEHQLPAHEITALTYFFNSNMHLWQTSVLETDLDNLANASNFFFNADKWSDDLVNLPKLRKIFLSYSHSKQGEIINESLRDYNFIGCKRLLLICDEVVKANIAKKVDAMSQQYSQFVADGVYQLADELAAVIKIFNPDFTVDAMSQNQPAYTTNPVKAERREQLPVKDIRRLAIIFYVNTYLEFQTSEMLRLQVEPVDVVDGFRAQEREFSKILDRAAFAQLMSQLKRSIEEVFQYVRQFVFVQIQTEAHNSHGYKLPVNSRSEVTFSDEQIVDYLTRVEHLFSLQGRSSIGGEAWATIADLGKQSWELDLEDSSSIRDVSKIVGLTDRIFQVHHNTGSVFNKNPKVHFQSELKGVFDFFAKQQDFADILAFASAQHCFTQIELDEMSRKYSVLLRLRTATVKTKTD